MQDGAARVAGGLLLLVALWIGVYWWWPSEPPISYASRDTAPAEPGPVSPVPTPPADAGAPGPMPEVPTPPSPRPPAVIVPEFTEHTVLPNETFASIAKSYYGSSSYATAISKANPFISPQTLSPGRVIRIPKDPKNIQGIPVTNPARDQASQPIAPKPVTKPPEPPPAEGTREYTVQSGDTLSTIAKKLYGDSRLSSLIFESNRDQMNHEDELKIGQKLKVPPKP